MGNLLARENIFLGTHFSINWLLKRNLIISLKVDAVQKFELFGHNEYMWAWGSLCTYNIKMKHGYIEVGSGVSFVSGQADIDIIPMWSWVPSTYDNNTKKIRTLGLDFKLARIYIPRAKNAGIAFSFYGNINNHTSFLNFGIGFKAPYFLNHKKQKP